MGTSTTAAQTGAVFRRSRPRRRRRVNRLIHLLGDTGLFGLSSVYCSGSVEHRTDTDGEVDFYQKDYYDNLNRIYQTDRLNTTATGNLIAHGNEL